MHMDAELWGEIHIVTVGNAKKNRENYIFLARRPN